MASSHQGGLQGHSSSAPDPSHTCDWPGCSRSYRKPDHLNRHKKTHLGDFGYRCSFCPKEYSRSDVLARHLAQSHGQRAAPVGRPRKSLRGQSLDHSSLQRDDRPSRWARDGNLEEMTAQHEDSMQVDPLPGDDTTLTRQGGSDTTASPPQPQNSNTGVPPLFLSASNLGQSVDIATFSAEDSIFPQYDHLFDWGFGEFEPYNFDSLQAEPQPITLNTATEGQGTVQDETNAEIRKALLAEEIDGQPNVEDLPDGSPAESSWPNVHRLGVSDGIITLPSTGPSSPRAQSMIELPTASVNSRARASMQMLARHAHQRLWPLPDLHTFPSSRSLTACINLYLANFSPWLPIVDSPQGSFRVDKAAPILLMAVASIGAIYGGQKLEALASPLNELVRREIVYTREFDQRFAFEPCVVQASLLQSYFGWYSGSPRLLQQAEVSRASLVAACRRMHLLHSQYSASKELERRGSTVGAQEVSRAAKQDHRNSRLGWSIFLFDAQLACLFGLPALLPMTDIQVPLPLPAFDSNNMKIPFSQVLRGLLDKGTLPEQPYDIGLSCLSYGLYRLCAEAAAIQSFSSGLNSSPRQTLTFPSYNKHPQDLMDQLAHLAINTVSAFTSLRLSCVALAYHSHLQFTSVGLLDQIQIAAGKLGDQASREAARETVTLRLSEDPRGARNIFAHAAMLRSLLNRFTFDTPTEVVWTFDSALCMWACLRFSSTEFCQSAGNDRRYLLSWNVSQSVDKWIETGQGDFSVPGLGGGADMSAEAVLRGAAERLDVMSWGLAMKYQKALKELVGECGGDSASGG